MSTKPREGGAKGLSELAAKKRIFFVASLIQLKETMKKKHVQGGDWTNEGTINVFFVKKRNEIETDWEWAVGIFKFKIIQGGWLYRGDYTGWMT